MGRFDEMPELAPCPFCGSDKAQFCYDYKAEISGIYCSRCQMKTVFSGIKVKDTDTYGKTMEQWAEKWNKRERGNGA